MIGGRNGPGWVAGACAAALLLVFASPAAGQAEEGCDPAVELCLLDAEPWIAPQHLRYQGPAEASERLVVRWSQD